MSLRPAWITLSHNKRPTDDDDDSDDDGDDDDSDDDDGDDDDGDDDYGNVEVDYGGSCGRGGDGS